MAGQNLDPASAQFKKMWADAGRSTNMYSGAVLVVRAGFDPEIVYTHREYQFANLADMGKAMEKLHQEVVEWHVQNGGWGTLDATAAGGSLDDGQLSSVETASALTSSSNDYLRGLQLVSEDDLAELEGFGEGNSGTRRAKRRRRRGNSVVGTALANVRRSYVGRTDSGASEK